MQPELGGHGYRGLRLTFDDMKVRRILRQDSDGFLTAARNGEGLRRPYFYLPSSCCFLPARFERQLHEDKGKKLLSVFFVFRFVPTLQEEDRRATFVVYTDHPHYR